MALASNVIFGMEIHLGHSSVSKSWVQNQGHSSEKVVVCNSKTTDQNLLSLGRNICYDNAGSFSEFVTTTVIGMYHMSGSECVSGHFSLHPVLVPVPDSQKTG